jgi:hypothetical protein
VLTVPLSRSPSSAPPKPSMACSRDRAAPGAVPISMTRCPPDQDTEQAAAQTRPIGLTQRPPL